MWNIIMEINNQETLTPWSLRDISKLFKRIYRSSLNKDNFKGMRIEHNILFYILSSTIESLLEERVKLICNLIKKNLGKRNYIMNYLIYINKFQVKKKINDKKSIMYIIKGGISLYYRTYDHDLYNELKKLIPPFIIYIIDFLSLFFFTRNLFI